MDIISDAQAQERRDRIEAGEILSEDDQAELDLYDALAHYQDMMGY